MGLAPPPEQIVERPATFVALSVLNLQIREKKAVARLQTSVRFSVDGLLSPKLISQDPTGDLVEGKHVFDEMPTTVLAPAVDKARNPLWPFIRYTGSFKPLIQCAPGTPKISFSFPLSICSHITS